MEDAWKNFETSGKITGYLTYRDTVRQWETQRPAGKEGAEKRKDQYGTEYRFDGDGFKCNADWRV